MSDKKKNPFQNLLRKMQEHAGTVVGVLSVILIVALLCNWIITARVSSAENAPLRNLPKTVKTVLSGAYEINTEKQRTGSIGANASGPQVYRPNYRQPDTHHSRMQSGLWNVGTGKTVYLTFDDGPCENTQELLDILAKYDAHVTFFVTNQFSEYQGMLQKEAAAGHAIGVHTYSHRYERIYSSPGAFWDDFNRMQEFIQAQTGSTTNLMRFPGGSSNTISANYCDGIMSELVKEATEKGYSYCDWNVDSTDADGDPDKDRIAQSIMRGIRDKDIPIILCHDLNHETIEAMETVLRWGRRNGYRFAALTTDSYMAHHGVNN